MGCFWFFRARDDGSSTRLLASPSRSDALLSDAHRLLVSTQRTRRPIGPGFTSYTAFFCISVRFFYLKKQKKEKYTQAGKQARALSLLPAVSLHARTRSRTSKPAARRAARNRAGSVKARCGFPQGGCKLILLSSALLVWASRRAPALCDGPLGSVSPQPPARPNATLRRDMIRDEED